MAEEVLSGKRRWDTIQGDCVAAMQSLPENSVDAICTDPPYGVEFMGKEWDKLDGDMPRSDDSEDGSMARWQGGGGFSKPGIGERRTDWPSFSSTSAANPTCETCGGRKRGKKKCSCAEPKWKPIGPRRSEVDHANRGTLTNMVNANGSQKFRTKAPAFDLSASSSSKMQKWHYEWAKEAFRVLKPGGHMLVFGGTRTHHRMWCAVEDAGFEVRDMIGWVYGQGFPKSLNVSKAFDKAAGAERKVVGKYQPPNGQKWNLQQAADPSVEAAPGAFTASGRRTVDITAPATEDAQKWDGWGTALKPSIEPILVARKPMPGNLISNLKKWGTGAINVDGCRVGTDDKLTRKLGKTTESLSGWKSVNRSPIAGQDGGRWPSNLVLTHTPECVLKGTKKVPGPVINRFTDGMKPFGDGAGHDYETVKTGDAEGMVEVEDWECAEGCPAKALDEQSGPGQHLQNPDIRYGGNRDFSGCSSYQGSGVVTSRYFDGGGASRFFPAFKYEAKVDSAERQFYCQVCKDAFQDEGGHAAHAMRCETCQTNYTREVSAATGMERLNQGLQEQGYRPNSYAKGGEAKHAGHQTSSNFVFHPTQKPVALMRWLVRLVTPPDGIVLDPFLGSGTTGVAAVAEGFRFVGIDKDPSYVQTARRRIEDDMPLFNMASPS